MTGIMRKIAYCLPIIAGICWGCCGVFVRVLDQAGFNNITITFSRVIIVVILLGISIFVYDRKLFYIQRRQLPLVALIGISGQFLFNICYNTAILKLSLSLATILLCTAPVFVIIFGAIIFKEKLTSVRIICMAAVLAGCVLLSGVIESGGLMWSVLGLAMGVGTAICNAGSTMAMNEASDIRGIHPLTVQFYAALFALIPMLPFTDYEVVGSFIAENPLARIPYLIVYALVAALLPNLLFNIAFKFMDSSIVSILASGAEPTSALIFGLVVYAEIPTVFGLVGTGLVIVAIIILTKAVSLGK
jgi:drug/metabolite transporter (DMT)-like permease